ncbi:MAG TPA: restriction endonuclease subunit S [Jatrophihabitans sp.]|nr:restriction endonuclease subunit S [Jatrophihabitans sp.]
MTWPVVPLAEVAEVRLGRQRSPRHHQGDSMRPYIRAANVTWTGLDLSDVKTMNFTDGEMATYRMEPGDIVLSEASGSPGEVGKPALWSGEIGECAFQNTLIRVRPWVHDPKFLTHYFHFLALDGQFVKHSRGVGIHHIGRARLASWPTPLPQVEEQRQIVDLLEDHLSRLDAADAYLDASRRRLLAMERSALANCRDGELRPLADVTAIQGGIQKQQKRAPKANAFPFLRVANVTARGLELDDIHQVELFLGELDRLRLQNGDLLVVEGNGSASQIGRAAIWDGSIDNCVHQNHLIRVRPLEGLLPEYLEAVWNSPLNRASLTEVASSSSGLHTLSVSKLKQISIPVPSLDRQRELVDDVTAVREAVARLGAGIGNAAAQRKAVHRSLLAAAFSGRLTG